jgi:hypothetical protein
VRRGDRRGAGEGIRAGGEADTGLFQRQVKVCAYEVWPGKLLALGVGNPRLHDDLSVSAALTAALDEID